MLLPKQMSQSYIIGKQTNKQHIVKFKLMKKDFKIQPNSN